MANSNGIITKDGASILSDICIVLGESNTNLTYLCGNFHGKINKWSFVKPMRHSNPFKLSENEFQGELSDVMNGIYCGIKLGTLQGRIKELLEVDYTYYPPNRAGDSCRELDFSGYNQNALPTPTATINNTIRYGNSEQGITLSFAYNPNNTTGVSLKRYYESGYADSGIVHSFDSCYLCVVVCDEARTQMAYIAATNAVTKTVTPIKYNGSYVQNFYVPLPATSATPTLFNKSSNTKLIVSAFLCYSLTPTDQLNPASLASWTSSGYDSTANTPRGCVAVPFGANIKCNLINEPQEATKPENKPIITTGISANENGITINWKKNLTTYSSVYVYINAGGYPYGSYGFGSTFSISGNAGATGTWAFSWNSLHIGNYTNGTVIDVEIQIFPSAAASTEANMIWKAEYQTVWTFTEDFGVIDTN